MDLRVAKYDFSDILVPLKKIVEVVFAFIDHFGLSVITLTKWEE